MSKILPANIATAAVAFVSSVVGDLLSLIDLSIDVAEFKADAAARAFASIVDMRREFGADTVGYMQAHVAIYGNGLNVNAAGYSPGSLRQSLELSYEMPAPSIAAESDDGERVPCEFKAMTKAQREEWKLYAAELRRQWANRVKFNVGQMRKVSDYLADPVRLNALSDDATMNSVYREALKNTSGKVKTDNKAPDAVTTGEAPSAVKVDTITTAVGELIGKFGMQAILGELSRILATERKTKTQAATLSAVSVQIAA